MSAAMEGYLMAGLFFLAVLAFIAVTLLAARILAPRKPGSSKSSGYECGVVFQGDAWGRFRVQYYLTALLFVIFDVEAVFLFPWAVVFRSAGLAGFAEMMIFISVLTLGLVVAWRNGALEWE
jgi:NADH-quinone oxidoreductase subunit A